MTATTPTWGMTYMVGSDRLCDGWTAIAAMAETLEGLLATFTATLNRITTIPYASISGNTPSYSPPITIGSIGVFNFDTVNADPYGYTNLSAQPSVISVPNDLTPAGGYWLTAFQELTTNAVNLSSDVSVGEIVGTVVSGNLASFSVYAPGTYASGGTVTFSNSYGAGTSFEVFGNFETGNSIGNILPGYTLFTLWLGDV